MKIFICHKDLVVDTYLEPTDSRVYSCLKSKFIYLSPVFICEVDALSKVNFPVGISLFWGAQWLSGRVLDSKLRGRGFEPRRRHCVVVLEQDTLILA